MPNWEQRTAREPPSDAAHISRMDRFIARIAQETGEDLADYHAAWRWSVENLESFWDQIIAEFDVELTGENVLTLSGDGIIGARVRRAPQHSRTPGRAAG